MRFDIVPYERAGQLTLGMTREAVRATLGKPWVVFKRVPTDAVPNDHFEELGVIVNYKPPGVVEAIEFTAPSEPTYKNCSLLRGSFQDVKHFLLLNDPSLTINADGLESLALGFGVYAPNGEDDPTEPSEGVIVFERGYYD